MIDKRRRLIHALLIALVMSFAAPGASFFNTMLPTMLTMLPYAVVIAGWIMYGKKNYPTAALCAKAPLALMLMFFICSTAATIINSALGFPSLKSTEIEQPLRQFPGLKSTIIKQPGQQF